MIKLTRPQIDALIECVNICDADEWPFKNVKREVARRAVEQAAVAGARRGRRPWNTRTQSLLERERCAEIVLSAQMYVGRDSGKRLKQLAALIRSGE